ncbi:restriction endonuclease subunit S [Lactobacillus mulieris]|jgi:restriction modification system|uniref:Restriction endonuclease subunit S n=1 Tax=Lactobacillus mulieris TaxID=2508708 RepID=A0AAP3GX10_9LACO|nr:MULTISPECIES: restriction endonuclease subunit S [Lactobacillus]EEU20471.1 hypothetical protein HMPREF0525_01415 [Lactobacillus jensenii 27-2-CHN]EEX23460.1 hypothetical protein HMPREF0974_01232 [Lactobacillus jensenii 115-3-CHN]EFH30475.1 hypothetical protein HMPREF0526_10628 [Lactobacillus jensenii JV-V16]KAA9244734.1 restriction endonuclease subunit S [Lactobacillus jensenii]KAA9367371.1 restriction endonuclease subunit S [Lactobacillus jensenii]
MPSDWNYVSLKDYAEVTPGYSYKGKELSPSHLAMATIKNFDRNGGFNARGFKEINPQKEIKVQKYANLYDVLVAHTDLTQNAEIIGNAEPILTCGNYDKIIFSMDLVKVTAKENKISKFLLALIMQGDIMKRHCLTYVNGTTVLHLNKKALKDFEFPFPENPQVISNIANFAEENYKKINSNLRENDLLIKIKSELLNKYF